MTLNEELTKFTVHVLSCYYKYIVCAKRIAAMHSKTCNVKSSTVLSFLISRYYIHVCVYTGTVHVMQSIVFQTYMYMYMYVRVHVHVIMRNRVMLVKKFFFQIIFLKNGKQP